MNASGLTVLVRSLYALQEERVEAYRLFDCEGHQAYLRSAPNYDFIRYRQLVHEITQAFNRISKEVIQLRDRFHEEFDRPDLSKHIERIQEREQEKLVLTAQLQLCQTECTGPSRERNLPGRGSGIEAQMLPDPLSSSSFLCDAGGSRSQAAFKRFLDQHFKSYNP
ncbi:LOW QUALITY PROTEIN: required for excision 1-B domain-containing protein [Pristis pectinata]|uniref:LOW QUALITY PROTEIN: required for excision 1-B domain-containing protein n=1 Tax=Pristis pectinata TaxID=685728 RepID=UPI00223D926F|nr:LOW QUALITY PROTEIN: required for excision 1-B domain-containing protein [Pristis pectinata]